MTPTRLEELRQLAGGIDAPKSLWMDELIWEVDRLNLQKSEMLKDIEEICEIRPEDSYTFFGRLSKLRAKYCGTGDALKPKDESICKVCGSPVNLPGCVGHPCLAIKANHGAASYTQKRVEPYQKEGGENLTGPNPFKSH